MSNFAHTEESSADSNNFPALASLPTPPDSSGARVLSSAQKTRNRRKRQLSKFLVIANEKGFPVKRALYVPKLNHYPTPPKEAVRPRNLLAAKGGLDAAPPHLVTAKASNAQREIEVAKAKLHALKSQLISLEARPRPTRPSRLAAKKKELQNAQQEADTLRAELEASRAAAETQHRADAGLLHAKDATCNSLTGSKHSHFKYFDVVNPSLGGAEVSSEFPGSLQLVDPLPEWASDMWERLYYIPLKAHPQTLEHGAAVDPASIHVASEDLLENVHEWDLPDKQLFSEEHTAQRLYLEDFCKYLSLLRPRSDLDHMPLAALRNGLLYYLASQMKSAAAFFEKRMEDRVKKLESLVDELLDQMREMTEVHKTEVSDMEDKHTEDSKLQLRVASHAAKFASAVIK
eukprot:gene10327-12213_t